MKESIFDKIFCIFLIALTIFIIGIQIGIAHGRELQKEIFYDYIITN